MKMKPRVMWKRDMDVMRVLEVMIAMVVMWKRPGRTCTFLIKEVWFETDVGWDGRSHRGTVPVQ